MKKCVLLAIVLALTACEKANEIFGFEETDLSVVNGAIIVMEDGREREYDGPVYLHATSWGTIVYVTDIVVNKRVKLLISESADAEGGRELDITSSVMTINDLNSGVRYYYCLVVPETGIKSQIKSIVGPDVSSLRLQLVEEGDKVSCVVDKEISEAFIEEKGFMVGQHRLVVEGPDFSFSMEEVARKYGLKGRVGVRAYLQTSNAHYHSDFVYLDFDTYTSEDTFNTEAVSFSEFTEETIGEVDYLKCVVAGYVDSAYFYKGEYPFAENILYPDRTEVSEDGKSTAFYLKMGYYDEIRLRAFYKFQEEESYWESSKDSEPYKLTHFNVRTADEFLAFVTWNSGRYYWDEIVLTLLKDITIPTHSRFCMRLNYLTIEGNGHTLDGISCFPLFYETSSAVIKDLKIGTNETVYDVNETSYSLSTTEKRFPPCLLVDGIDIRFENCEIRGTIRVSGSTNFSLMPYYKPNESTVVGDGYVEIVSGLKDYTKTEYETTTNK